MTDTSARSAIITRIRKLAQMTTENGCSEAEAQTALGHLARLMAEHSVTQDEMSIRLDARACEKDYFAVLAGRRAEWMDCGTAIAKYTKTRAWWAKEWDSNPLGLGAGIGAGYVTKYYFFGLPQDVAMATGLCLIVSNALTTEAERWITQRKQAKLKTYKGEIEGFLAGMVQRLRERLLEMATPPKAGATGTSLIVLKDQLVTEEFAKLNLRLTRRSAPQKSYDPASHAAGYARGAQVGLTPTSHQTYGHRQIEGKR